MTRPMCWTADAALAANEAERRGDMLALRKLEIGAAELWLRLASEQALRRQALERKVS